MRFATLLKSLPFLIAANVSAGVSWSTVQPVTLVGSEVCASGSPVHYFFLKDENFVNNGGQSVRRPFYYYDNNPLKGDWAAKLLSAEVSGQRLQVLYDNVESNPGCAINPGFKVSAIQISN